LLEITACAVKNIHENINLIEKWIICVILCIQHWSKKGKPGENRRRKAMGLLLKSYDCQAAADLFVF
jgi:hypothetical protein